MFQPQLTLGLVQFMAFRSPCYFFVGDGHTYSCVRSLSTTSFIKSFIYNLLVVEQTSGSYVAFATLGYSAADLELLARLRSSSKELRVEQGSYRHSV